jgi:hypothetical protein
MRGSQVGTYTGIGEWANFDTTGKNTRGIAAVPIGLGLAVALPAYAKHEQRSTVPIPTRSDRLKGIPSVLLAD